MKSKIDTPNSVENEDRINQRLDMIINEVNENTQHCQRLSIRIFALTAITVIGVTAWLLV